MIIKTKKEAYFYFLDLTYYIYVNVYHEIRNDVSCTTSSSKLIQYWLRIQSYLPFTNTKFIFLFSNISTLFFLLLGEGGGGRNHKLFRYDGKEIAGIECVARYSITYFFITTNDEIILIKITFKCILSAIQIKYKTNCKHTYTHRWRMPIQRVKPVSALNGI